MKGSTVLGLVVLVAIVGGVIFFLRRRASAATGLGPGNPQLTGPIRGGFAPPRTRLAPPRRATPRGRVLPMQIDELPGEPDSAGQSVNRRAAGVGNLGEPKATQGTQRLPSKINRQIRALETAGLQRPIQLIDKQVDSLSGITGKKLGIETPPFFLGNPTTLKSRAN